MRWRNEQGHPRSRVVGLKRDAEALDQDLRRAKRLGGGAVVANSRETLADFSKLWWARHAPPKLARHAPETYASALDVHIIPRLGEVRLQALTTELISDMRAELAAAGRVTPTDDEPTPGLTDPRAMGRQHALDNPSHTRAQPRRPLEAGEVPDLGSEPDGGERVDPAQAPQPGDRLCAR